MTQRIQTQELLEALMAGHEMAPSEIDDLLRCKVSEDLFLEYKHATELNDRKKANRTIRQYLSGFANSAGGVLIIGVDENTWSVTPCPAIQGGLEKWASSCLTEIAHYFSLIPRFQVVEHPNGNVLVAATSRSLNLVPCKERGEFVYYMRFHDQTLNNKTLKVPEYLISDLVLGRRQQPHLHVSQFSLQLSAHERREDYSRVISFDMNFMIENESLSWANEVRLGMVGYVFHGPIPLSNHLLSYLDIQKPNGGDNYNLYHIVISEQSGLTIDLGPFSITTLNIPSNTIPIRVLGKFHSYTWKAAVYVMSKESPPIWYQINLEVNDRLLKAANARERIFCDDDLLKITRLTNNRPSVGWDGFSDQTWR